MKAMLGGACQNCSTISLPAGGEGRVGPWGHLSNCYNSVMTCVPVRDHLEAEAGQIRTCPGFFSPLPTAQTEGVSLKSLRLGQTDLSIPSKLAQATATSGHCYDPKDHSALAKTPHLECTDYVCRYTNASLSVMMVVHGYICQSNRILLNVHLI